MRTVSSPQCENHDCHYKRQPNSPFCTSLFLAHFYLIFTLIHLCLRKCVSVISKAPPAEADFVQFYVIIATLSTVLCQSLRQLEQLQKLSVVEEVLSFLTSVKVQIHRTKLGIIQKLTSSVSIEVEVIDG